MKRILFSFWLVVLGGILSNSFAQSDSSDCDLQAWFTTGFNPNGVPTYTAQYTGGGVQPQYFWSVNGNYVSNQQTYSAQLAPGTQVCLEVRTHQFTYDSLQQWTNVDTCFAYYCETIYEDSMGGCDLQAWFTTGFNPNGVPTYTAQYTGGGIQPQYFWSVNGNYVSNQQTYSAQLAPGTQVCLEVRTHQFTYDSLQQWTDVDTCFAYYCETIYEDSMGGCDLQAWYTYEENPNGGQTFTGYYSGAGEQVQYFWSANGIYVGGQQTLTGNYSGMQVCLEVRTHHFAYDSLQQWTDVDTCFAYHCETIAVAALDELPEIGFTLYPNPASDFISLKTDAEITAVEIRDMNGRLVLVSDRKEGIDISTLTQGVYCVRATDTSGRFSQVERFIRE